MVSRAKAKQVATDLRPFVEMYLNLGLFIIPTVRGGKQPKITWKGKPRPTLAEWNEWLAEWPTSLCIGIGCVLGLSDAPDGKMLADAEPDDDTARAWFEAQDPQPRGWQAASSRSVHHLGWVPTDRKMLSAIPAKKAGLPEVRTGPNITVLPPSIHKSGVAYTWLAGLGPGESELDDLPDWVVSIMPPATPPRVVSTPRRFSDANTPYGQAALDREAAALAAMAPESGRNNALNEAALRLGQLVAGGELSEDDVREALVRACEANGLVADDGRSKTEATLNSGLRKGLSEPRTAPETPTQDRRNVSRMQELIPDDNDRLASLVATADDLAGMQASVQPEEPATTAEAGSSGELPDHCTAAVMAKAIGDTEWLWNRWLPVGQLCLLASKQGRGKSALALHLENCVATGCDWPDGAPGTGTPGYALHVETEGFQGGHAERMEAWGVNKERIIYLGKDGLGTIRLEDPKSLEAVSRLVCYYSIKLVIIDALRRATKHKENESELAMTLAPWQDLSRDTKCCILVLHHCGKGFTEDAPPTLDDVRGTSAIGDVVRSALGLWRPDPQRKGFVEVVQMKPSLLSQEEAANARFTFEWDPVGGLDFDTAEAETPKDKTEKGRASDFIFEELARQRGRATRKHIIAAAQKANITRDRIDTAAGRLKREGWLLTLAENGVRYWSLVDRHR